MAVVLKGWVHDDERLHAVVARAVGMRLNLAYLAPTGSWLTSHQTPYDATGRTPGTWRFVEDE